MADRTLRASIIERSLNDIGRRLTAFPQTPLVQELAARVRGYHRVIATWDTAPPPEEFRAALLRRVLDINIDLIRAGLETESISPDSDDFAVGT